MRSGRKQWYVRAMEGKPTKVPPVYAWAMTAIPAGYCETADPYDWVPVQVLYHVYTHAWFHADHSEHEPMLGVRQFAVALRLVFPNGESCRRRSRSGVTERGIAGVTGPHAERSPDEQMTYRRRRKPRVDSSR
jgi:hypothetical protein